MTNSLYRMRSNAEGDRAESISGSLRIKRLTYAAFLVGLINVASIPVARAQDFCHIHYPAKGLIGAMGECRPKGTEKSCHLQERRHRSTQPWKDSTLNPTKRESEMEYRPNCHL